MLHFDRWKIYTIICILIAGLMVALPNFFSKEVVSGWPDFVPKSQMPLGLDLRGGAHLLMSMDTEEVRKDWLTSLRDDARKQLRDAKLGFSAIGVAGDAMQVRLVKPEESEKALVELKKLVQPIGNAVLGTSGEDLEVFAGSEPGIVLIKPSDQGLQERVSGAVSASIETINRRINALGTAESTVVRQGQDRILIQFPGVSDTKQLKELIGKTAKLTFHAVHPSVTAEEARQTRVPIGYKIYESAEDDDPQAYDAYVLLDAPVVPGNDLVDSQPGFDQQTNEPIITFRFNQSGARKFGSFTEDNVGQPFAIVLDEKVISAPVIREAIRGGSGQISGNFTVESANNLAIQLRSGALPAKLTIVEERTVGPSLGADSVESGKIAGWIGTIAVAGFMIFAYGLFGVFAILAVLANLLLIVAVMSLIGSTLTLPGIAGLVLTVGMAVDANVLIYERIREELRTGRPPISAIDAGFTRALATILDSNLTTLIAGIVMFWLGSGPVRGFAVTLSLGIFATVFTAFTLTRLFVSLWLKAQKTRKIAVPL
jgi:protein-export membrane protein SecD